jgi:hypothetical protein
MNKPALKSVATPSKATQQHEVVMLHSKSTKGTHVYSPEKPDGEYVCSQVYLSKKKLGEEAPSKITLIVKVD